MDKTNSKILNRIQKEFPFCSKPYQALGQELGLSEKEVFERIRKLKKGKIIRRIGAIFDTRKLGYKTTLVAMKVIPKQLSKVAAIVNSYSEVSHNYLRTGEYNLWFTLTCPDRKMIKRIIKEIREKTGLTQMLNLPAIDIFKLKTDFRV